MQRCVLGLFRPFSDDWKRGDLVAESKEGLDLLQDIGQQDRRPFFYLFLLHLAALFDELVGSLSHLLVKLKANLATGGQLSLYILEIC